MTSLCENEIRSLEWRVDNGLKILQTYSWLLDSFVLDFYTDNHWEKLPKRWQEFFDGLEPEELGKLLDYRDISSRVKRVWPLSFLALRAAAHHLSIPRKRMCYIKASNCHLSMCSENVQVCCSRHNLNQDCLRSENAEKIEIPHNPTLLNPKFSHVFIKHVKPKKRHEVQLMAKITADTASSSGCRYVVDVGSGLGHLARTLAYGYGLHVCCLEAQSGLSEQARKLDLELEVTAGKYSNLESTVLNRPVHLNFTLCSSVDHEDFVQALKKAFGCVRENDFTFGIVGLHPCGDLGPILLQLLAKCPSAVFLNIVGCCYMKLTTLDKSIVPFQGYPLSSFISKRPHALSYEAREIACHAIENYCERLCNGDISHLKVHCYRATLETLLVKHWPELRHSGIRSVRHADKMAFDRYCQVACERLGIQVPGEETGSQETLQHLSQWKKVVTFYSLRLLLAPLVESVLLMDRLLYLHQLGLKCWLQPVFDPCLSPRNHILIAIKNET